VSLREWTGVPEIGVKYVTACNGWEVMGYPLFVPRAQPLLALSTGDRVL